MGWGGSFLQISRKQFFATLKKSINSRWPSWKLGFLAAKLIFKSVLGAPAPPLRSLLTKGGVGENYDLLLALPPPPAGLVTHLCDGVEVMSQAGGPWKMPESPGNPETRRCPKEGWKVEIQGFLLICHFP